jgi:hypothetical protein
MSLFGYSVAGFVVAEGAELLVWDAKIDSPAWSQRLGAPILAVGSAGAMISAVEASGTLSLFNAGDGSYAGGASYPGGHTLAATTNGVAVATKHTIEILDGAGPRSLSVAGVSAIRFSRDGSMLGVGFGDGRVMFLETATGRPLHEAGIPGGIVNAVAERAPGEWLACAGSAVHLVSGRGVQRVTGLTGATIRDVTSGPRSSFFGLIANNAAIALEWPSRDTIGSLDFPEKMPLGVAFDDDGFYVGLSGGDGNRLDLRSGNLYRTDPHPNHTKNRWLVSTGFEDSVALRALAQP